MAAMRRGDNLLLSDMVLELEKGCGKWIVIEYDGVYYHTQDRVEADIKKTKRLLELDSEKYVAIVRLRIHGTPYLDTAYAFGDRCVIMSVPPCTSGSNAANAVRQLCGCLLKRGLVPDSVRPRFDSAQRHIHKCGIIDYVCASIRQEMSHKEEVAFNMLKHCLDGDVSMANKFREVNGVITRVELVCAGIDRLRDEWGMDKRDVCTFMSDSVAAAIGEEKLWLGLERLRTDWGMDKRDLRTFMSSSVAAAIGEEKLWLGLERLRTDWGMDKRDLRTFMSNSVAAACLLYTSPSPRDKRQSRMPSSA